MAAGAGERAEPQILCAGAHRKQACQAHAVWHQRDCSRCTDESLPYHQWEALSKPLAVDDPLLLPEREVHSEIGINWFLDQEIPKGGYVRILAESLLWEERLGKTRIKTTEGLTTCMEPHRGWTITTAVGIFYESDG